MTRLLVSVRSADESRAALAGGADIVDVKEPAAGALGRAPEATLRAIVDTVAGARPVSATIGDMPLMPEPVAAAVRATAATGVDIVKIGFFEGDTVATLTALTCIAEADLRWAAVFFADRSPDPDLVDRCAAAGAYAVMFDTADKAAGSLLRHRSLASLAAFIERGRAHRLFVGLAGALQALDVPRLLPLRPDFLGFRSAVTAGRRDGPLDRGRLAHLRALFDGEAPRMAGHDRISNATATAGAQSAARSAQSGAGTRSAKLR